MRTVSQDGKDNHRQHGYKDYDNQHLDCRQQEAAESDERTEQGYYEENECGNAADCFEK